MHMHVETMNMVPWMTTEWECKCMFVHLRALIHWYANEMHAYTLRGIFSLFFL